jgi:hypothetical protein
MGLHEGVLADLALIDLRKPWLRQQSNIIEKQAEDPFPFRGGDECRTLSGCTVGICPHNANFIAGIGIAHLKSCFL